MRPGGRVVLVGRVTTPNGRKVAIRLLRRGRWTRARTVRQAADGSFRARLRLRRVGAARPRLKLQRARLPRGVRKLVLRAQVPRVGRSARVRLRVRR